MKINKLTALFLSLGVITISAISCIPTPADTSQTQQTTTSTPPQNSTTLATMPASTTTITSFPLTSQTTISTQSMSSSKPKTTTVTTKPTIRTTTTTPHATITTPTITTTSPTTTTTPTEMTTVTTSAPAPALLSLQIVSVTSPVKAGASATLVAQTKPKAECAITVYLKSGPSKATGLTKINADSDGKASWTWKVGSSTTHGEYKIVVTAGLGGETVSQTTYFTVQ